jgi:hypothetical protein
MEPSRRVADLLDMTTVALSRPVLRVVGPAVPTPISFCSHCGAHAPAAERSARVCPDCAAGLLLETTVDALPGPDDAFLVVDSSLAVQALSVIAEIELGIREPHAVNRHVAELLIEGDVEPDSDTTLAGAIVRAASGQASDSRIAVRPSHTFGVRLMARIAACGPPPAALIVLERPFSA